MFRRIVSFCFAERGIGVPSRARVLLSWLTLYPLRRLFGKLFRNLVLVETPEWATRVQAKVLVGNLQRVSWYDWLNPIRWSVWVLGFVYEWILSRRYYEYGPAVPGILLACLIPTAILVDSFKRDSWRETYYRELLQSPTAKENNRLAGMAMDRLLERTPDRTDLRLQRAMLAERLGNADEARTEMESLAVVERNSIAAFWLMQKHYQLADVGQWDENKHQAYRLLAAIAASHDNESVFVASRVVLSQYLVSIGATAEAIAQIESVSGDNSELQLVCAALHYQNGDQSSCTRWAEKAQEGLRKSVLAAPANIETRLKLARALLLLGQSEAVAVTLSDGYKLTKDERLLNAGAESFVAWAARIENSEPQTSANLVKRLSLLSRATDLAPKNSLALETLVNAVIQCAESTDPEVAKLRDTLVRKLDADKVHFIQGTIALLRGDVEQADGHLQLAMAKSASVPGVLNNLAVVLYQKESPDLDRALTLVNAALKSLPDQPQIRETRGQIFLRMKHYKEAIFDLEFALAAKEPPQTIHKSLAQAYEAIGLVDMAKSHLEMASN